MALMVVEIIAEPLARTYEQSSYHDYEYNCGKGDHKHHHLVKGCDEDEH